MKANPKLDFQIQNFKKTLHEKRILLQNFRFSKFLIHFSQSLTWVHWRQSYINRISRFHDEKTDSTIFFLNSDRNKIRWTRYENWEKLRIYQN